MSLEKKVVIIAGPDGAGKTTFAREFLPAEAGLPVFINADLIAAGFSPFAPEAAAFRAGELIFLSLASAEERQRVDVWQWYDNSGPRPRLVEEGSNR